MKTKGKQSTRFSSPVIISSDESDHEASRTPIVKTEPVDSTEALQGPPRSSAKAKGKQLMPFSSPFIISTDDSDCDVSTPKAKKTPTFAKHKALYV